MNNIRILQYINHLLFIAGISYTLYVGDYSYLILSIVLYYVLGILGVNIGFHRLLSHRSFTTYKPVYYLLSILGTLTALGSPLAWVAVHRQHHRHSDSELDPHSPYRISVFKVWTGQWGNIKIDLRNCKDIRREQFHRFIHNRYIYIQLIYIVILMLIDPMLVIFAYAIPSVLVFHSAGALNVISHRHGYRNHNTKDHSTNSWIANIITMGEGWHNNHHARPGAWNNQDHWWEVDITGLIIRVIKK